MNAKINIIYLVNLKNVNKQDEFFLNSYTKKNNENSKK